MDRSEIALSPFAVVGRETLFVVRELGRIAIFLGRGVVHMFSWPLQIQKLLAQIYFIGFKSIIVVSLTGAFTGMVLGFQGYYTLVKFGSEGLLGTVVSLTLIRELGPVLTAIMVAGRAGSAMAAEIGIMRISEQIDALETMNINSIRFLFSPRLGASLLSFPLLTALFDVIGIFGGYLTGSILLGISPGIYMHRTQAAVQMVDINGGFIKSLIFGVLVVTVCCFQGYYTHLRKEGFGAKGVSSATTSAVVISSVLILAADYVLTSFLM